MFTILFSSLREEIHKDLRISHPFLFRTFANRFKSWIHAILNSKWAFIPLGLFISIFILCTLHISPEWLSFIDFDEETFNRAWIDQRITNSVALFSGCLALIAWFYTNVGIKEPHAY